MRCLPRSGGRIPGAPGESGSAIVEMVFVLPLLLLLVFGIFEFGRAWLITNTLNHATREAVRLASTTAGLTADDPTVVAKATDLLSAAGVTGASVTNTAPSGTPSSVTVTATLNFGFVTGIGPFFGFRFSGTIPLTGSATMRYER